MRVLLVEDDELLGDGIRTGLKHYGHTVDWIKDGKTANDVLSAKHESFDIVVLDLGLPKMSGLEVLRNLRNRNSITPVVILTAREMVDDRVKGLDAGADDYLTKPFDLDELCARMRALQRRSKARAKPMLVYGSISLDPASHVVTLDGEEVMISRREFALLQKLLENSGRVISREQLNQTLYGWGENIDSNALEVHIHNLRKRFGNNVIRTIRGVGYMAEKVSEPVE
ncbi:MAG: response regulator [Gammaproteobacteria bacterium]|nr:response regulator [Gammaproteobacteria bacterium]MCH9743720.1 response regulator [Gammaproteobacteria bacterium]